MNRLTGEQDGGQANGWGHSVSQTEFLAGRWWPIIECWLGSFVIFSDNPDQYC